MASAEQCGRLRKRLPLTRSPTSAEIEIDDVIDMLLESYKDAKDANQHGPAVRAVELLGKHLAMFKGRISFEEQGTFRALAAGDGRKRQMLRAVLGAGDSFDATRH